MDSTDSLVLTPLKKLFEDCLNANYFDFGDYGSVAAKISPDGRTLYIYFQWSKGRRDWINNFAFASKAYKRMKFTWRCHRGFLRVWKSIQDQVLKLAFDAVATSPQIDTIVCVGYSHGAPLAALAVENFKYLGLSYKVFGVGFGSPKFIWGKLPPEVGVRFDTFTNVSNRNDIVTYMPPRLFGYDYQNAVIVLPQLDPLDKYGCFKAHYPENYMAALSELDLYLRTDGTVCINYSYGGT